MYVILRIVYVIAAITVLHTKYTNGRWVEVISIFKTNLGVTVE